ncbi:hypothetical protein J6590_098342 [Homalodisca vitripennis]|nr:hypothetical protein J6590_098342 [Homalodisca vitripennis]
MRPTVNIYSYRTSFASPPRSFSRRSFYWTRSWCKIARERQIAFIAAAFICRVIHAVSSPRPSALCNAPPPLLVGPNRWEWGALNDKWGRLDPNCAGMAVYDANQLWDEEEDVVESLEYVTPRVGTSYCEEGPRKGLAGSNRRPSREHLMSVRKRLFYDGPERPTTNIFYMEGERIDMEDLTTCEIQRWFFARIFNSMLYFSKCTFTEQNSIHRSLKWQAKLTESRLKKLQANGYKDFHVSITSAVSYILRALEDIRYIRDDELIFQLVPNTCLIDNIILIYI